VVKKSPRIDKKKTGNVTISDGKLKMEIKERWRFWVAVIGVFGFFFIFIAWFIPALTALLTSAYLLIGFMWAKGISMMNWGYDRVKWVARWCAYQPYNDIKNGREMRKKFGVSNIGDLIQKYGHFIKE